MYNNECLTEWRLYEEEQPERRVICVARDGSMRSDSGSDAERLTWLENGGGCEGFLVVLKVAGLAPQISLSNPQSQLLRRSAWGLHCAQQARD